jgi:hypothetical protein
VEAKRNQVSRRARLLIALLAALAATAPGSAGAQPAETGQPAAPAEEPAARGPRAEASKRVLLLDFGGANARSAQRLVARALGRHVELRQLPSSEPIGLVDADYVVIAGHTKAVAVVTGEVARQRRTWYLAITVRDGANGGVVSRVRISLGGVPRLTVRTRRQVVQRVVPALARALATAEPAPAESETPTGMAPNPDLLESGSGPEEGESEPTETGAPDPVAEDELFEEDMFEEEPGAEGEDEDADTEVETWTGRVTRHPGLEFVLRMQTVRREVSFESAPTATAPAPTKDGGEPMWVGGAAGELYPAAFFKPTGVLGGFGLYGSYQRGLQSEGGQDDHERLEGGALYRVNVGGKVTRPSFKLSVGYVSFESRLADSIVPEVHYRAVSAGGGARVPLWSSHLALRVEAEYLAVLDTGAISKPENYGDGDHAGVDFDGAFEVRAFGSLFLLVGGTYGRFTSVLDGTGAMTDVDGVPGADVGRADDVYASAYLAIGASL